MNAPLQITFRDMPPSTAVEQRVRTWVERLTKCSDRITGCHVTLAYPHRHHLHGRRFLVRIDLALPGKEIIVNRDHVKDGSHENIYAAIRDAFRAARRELVEAPHRRN